MVLAGALLVGVAAGVGSGWAAFRAAPPGPTALTESAPSAVEAAAPQHVPAPPKQPPPRPVEPVTARPAEQPGMPVAPKVPEGGYATLEEAVAAIPSPAWAKGDGVIHGTIRSNDGAPIPGVTVWVERVVEYGGRQFGSAGEPEPTLAEAVREAIEAQREAKAVFQRVQTGADGRYELNGLAPRLYRVKAWAKGWAFTAVPAHSELRVRPGTTLDFSGRGNVTLTLDVRLPDGSKPEEVEVYAKGTDVGGGVQGRPFRWSPESPTIQLPAGEVTLQVGTGNKHAGSFRDARYTSEPVTLRVSPGMPATPIVLQLIHRPGLVVRVLPAPGE